MEAQVEIFHYDIVSHYNFCTLLCIYVFKGLGKCLVRFARVVEDVRGAIIFAKLAAICVKCL